MKQQVERGIQETCAQVLELDGWRRLRTDPVSDRSTVATIRARFMATPALAPVLKLLLQILASCVRGKGFGELGMADDLFLRYPAPSGDPAGIKRGWSETLWIEWKRPGGRVDPHQTAWHEAERRRGALVIVAGVDFKPATVDAFLAWYFASGLARDLKQQGGNK